MQRMKGLDMTKLWTTDHTRRVAFVAGIFYLLTFIGSIPASILLPPALSGANYITGAGADAPIGLAAILEMVNVLTCIGTAVAGVRDWAIVIGPGMAAFNALMFGTLLYRARLVPRAIPALGIVGAPLMISWVIGTMLGITGPFTVWQGIAVAPFFIWELVVGLWMTFKGFNPSSPILSGTTA